MINLKEFNNFVKSNKNTLSIPKVNYKFLNKVVLRQGNTDIAITSHLNPVTLKMCMRIVKHHLKQ